MTVKKIRPILDHIIVQDMDFGEQKTKGGIIVVDDDGKLHGIKPRWGKVYAVGPKQTDVKAGDWVLVEHGRWTRGIDLETEDGSTVTVRRVESASILMSSDAKPADTYVATN